MSPEIVTIIALVVIFAIATVLPDQHGRAGLRRRVPRRHAVGRACPPRRSSARWRAVPAGARPDADRRHVPVRHRAEQRHRRPAGPGRRAAGRRPRGRHPVDHVRVTALLTAIGALSPAAVAIIAPIALSFAARHGINPLLMGMMVIHGAQGGGFSPISVYGVTVNTIVEDEACRAARSRSSWAACSSTSPSPLVLFFVLGGRKLIGRKVAVAERRSRPSTSRRGARELGRRRRGPADTAPTTAPGGRRWRRRL